MIVNSSENIFPQNVFQARKNSEATDFSQPKTQFHIHEDASEIFLINKGSIFCNFDKGDCFTAEAGDVVFINGKTPHETIAEPGTVINFLFIDINFFIRKFYPHLPTSGCIIYRENYAVFRKQTRENTLLTPFLQAFPSDSSPGYTESSFGQGYLIIAALKDSGFLKIPLTSPESTLRILNPVFEFLNKNFRENISVSELAAAASYNKDYFSRIFRKATGLTITEYINKLRLAEARYLLLNTEKSVTEISLEAGFGSPAYFFKLFSKRYSMSPQKYRSLYNKHVKKMLSD